MLVKVLLSSVLALTTTLSSAEACQDKDLPKGMKSLSIKDLEALQRPLKEAAFLTVDFKQNIQSTLRRKPREIGGKGYFAKPSRIKWMKDSPKEEITYDGKDLFIYRPDEKTAFKFSSRGSQAAEFEKLMGLVLNLEQLLDRYELISALEDAHGGNIYLRLKPKRDVDLQHVSVELTRSPVEVQRVCLGYEKGKEISYNFSNHRRSKLDDQIFIFNKPKDVKIEVFD